MKLRDSFAQATRVPRTAPQRKPQSATARVIAVAKRSEAPHPPGPKPISSKKETGCCTTGRSAASSAAAPRTTGASSDASALRRHVDLEPLLGELRDGSVGDRRGDRGVEQRLQLGSGLAHADGDAAAEHVAREAGTDDRHVLEVGLLDRRLEGGVRREDRVEPARGEVE